MNQLHIRRPIGSLAFLLALFLFLPACGGGDSPEPQPQPMAEQVEQPADDTARTAPPRSRDDDTMDPKLIEGRTRDGVALAVADELRPELAAALPPAFPDDIPLGNWIAVSSVRQMGETDFVLSCLTSYPRDAVGEFFVHQMPQQGWKLVNRSNKPILSVLTFRKEERAVTVMLKKQARNEDVAFDISYKEN